MVFRNSRRNKTEVMSVQVSLAVIAGFGNEIILAAIMLAGQRIPVPEAGVDTEPVEHWKMPAAFGQNGFLAGQPFYSNGLDGEGGSKVGRWGNGGASVYQGFGKGAGPDNGTNGLVRITYLRRK